MDDYPSRIAFDQALRIIEQAGRAHALPAERVALSRCHGRVLAQDVVAGIDLPGFDNSAMDGFALRHADLAGEKPLRLVGDQFAGLAQPLSVGAGQCVRITTGSPVPPGADTVAIKETCRVEDGHVRVLMDPGKPIAIGRNIRRAGEDVRRGDTVLRAGQVLTPLQVSLAASLGMQALDVATRPTVAVFTTGDELVEPGVALRPGQIYNSNRELLMGLLREAGLEPTAWPNLPDTPAAMTAMLRDAAASFDLVVTCGGVSAGEKDHLPELARAHGRIHFWKVRMKPGMPLLFAGIDRALLLGLPGNPVSVLATWLALGRPLVDAMQGRVQPRPRWRAVLAAPWHKRHERLELLRGRLSSGDDGQLLVVPEPADGSHRLHAAATSDALIVLPEGEAEYAAGSLVDVLPY